MFDYLDAQQTADELIEFFGSSSSIYTPAIDGGGYDNNGNPLPSQPREDILGLATPVLSYKKDEIDGDVIQATDGYIFFSPDDKSQAIKIGMLYESSGKKYRVQDLSGITSNDGIKVYQKVQLRS